MQASSRLAAICSSVCFAITISACDRPQPAPAPPAAAPAPAPAPAAAPAPAPATAPAAPAPAATPSPRSDATPAPAPAPKGEAAPPAAPKGDAPGAAAPKSDAPGAANPSAPKAADGKPLSEDGYVIEREWKENFPNGKPKTRCPMVRHPETGKLVKHGMWRTWNEDGSLNKEGRYVLGVQDGEWKFWYPGLNQPIVEVFKMGTKLSSTGQAPR